MSRRSCCRTAATAWILLALISPAFSQEEILHLVTLQQEIPIGAAFDVGVQASDELNGATVTGLRFLSINDPWHVNAEWRQPPSGVAPKEDWLWSARLQAFEVGEQQIPPVEAVLRRPDGTTEVIQLEGPVVNVVDGIDSTDAQLRDLHDIHPFSLDWRWIAAWAALGLIAALALGLLVRRSYLARETGKAVPPPPPPGEWALGEIERRRNLSECRAGHSKVIATEASDVIRHFLERQYGFNALDMTTKECVRRLESKYVPGGFPAAVGAFLEECDVAKFARLDLAPGRDEAIWKDARALVAHALREQVDMPNAEAVAEARGPAR